MNEFVEKYQEVKDQLNGLGAGLKSDLIVFTQKLIDLVEKKEIVSFSFSESRDFSGETMIGDRNYLNVRLDMPQDNKQLLLGVFEDISELPQFSKLSPAARKILNDFNEVLSFANEYLNKDIPDIKNKTYYSHNAANGLAGFAQEPMKHLLPEFYTTDPDAIPMPKSRKP